MTFGQAVSICFRKYATFRGRAPRPEFWYFVLFLVLVLVPLLIIGLSTSESVGPGDTPPLAVVAGLAYLAVLLPYWAVLVRRLHDTGRSGWFIFVALIPFVGGIVLLILLASRGTVGPNGYGPDPLADHRVPVERGTSPYGQSPELGRKWHVSEPGASLVDSPGGAVVARLPAGTEVVELERRDGFVNVTTWDGRSGWLERRSVF